MTMFYMTGTRRCDMLSYRTAVPARAASGARERVAERSDIAVIDEDIAVI